MHNVITLSHDVHGDIILSAMSVKRRSMLIQWSLGWFWKKSAKGKEQSKKEERETLHRKLLATPHALRNIK